ncbi:hypothetical protein, partial [Mesorhizobium sp.]
RLEPDLEFRVVHFALEPLSLALAAGIEGWFLDRLEKCRTFFGILPLLVEVKFVLNRRNRRAQSNTLDLENDWQGLRPCPLNAKTLSRVHLQDRFVGLCVPLVLVRKGRSALRPCRLRASSTDGLSRGSGVSPRQQNAQEGAPGKALSIAPAFGHFDTQKPHDLNV